MKKIIITEQQFKRLIENIINEKENDIFEDPRVKSLLDYLNSTKKEDFGFLNIEPAEAEKEFSKRIGMPIYKTLNTRKYYAVGTWDEFEKYLKSLPYNMNINWNHVSNLKYGDYYVHQIS